MGRVLWAKLLADVYHMPLEMFMTTERQRTGLAGKGFGNMPGPQQFRGGGGAVSTPGTYTIPIKRIETSKYAQNHLGGIASWAAAVDRDGNGTLDFHEFATLVLVLMEFYEPDEKKGGKTLLGSKPRTNKRPKADVLKLLYSILDEDGDGQATKSEFESFAIMMARLGHTRSGLASADYDALWKVYDQNEDGVLSFTEFVAFAKQMLDLDGFPGEWPAHA